MPEEKLIIKIKKVLSKSFFGQKFSKLFFFDKNLEKFVQIGSSLKYGKKIHLIMKVLK